MASCAYCGDETPLTREHIIPSFLYKVMNEFHKNNISWLEKSSKFIRAEHTVKDVCASCNNGVLADLDGVANAALSKSGIYTPCFLLDSLTLGIEYITFARWLLKIFYNSSRVNNRDVDLYKRFASLIINGVESGCEPEFFISMGVLKPELIIGSEIQTAGINPSVGEKYNPFGLRVSRNGNYDEFLNISILTIGALLIHFVVFKEELRGLKRKRVIDRYKKNNKGFRILDRNLEEWKVEQLPFGVVNAKRGQFLRRPVLKAFLDSDLLKK